MSTARAHPNIALLKYWGKRDEALHLPTTTSLSMTFDIFPTTTTVTPHDGLADDVRLDGRPAPETFTDKVIGFLDLVRKLSGDPRRAHVDTVNTVPLGAGLASSAAGFAALAVASSDAYGLHLDDRALTRLARRGSGSASRSIHGGFVQWHRGDGLGDDGDTSSYAEPVDASRLDAAMVVAVVNDAEKPVSSRIAMRRTMETSPFYQPWVDSAATDLVDMRAAIAAGDLHRVGAIAERNFLGMHATMLGARPAVCYPTAASMLVLSHIGELRSGGLSVHATMDAGPNVKILCARRDADDVVAALTGTVGRDRLHITTPGPAAVLVES